MVLFCAAIRRDSVFLLRFPFLCHFQAFLCEISLVCHLRYPYNCFSSHFCFLVIVVLLILVMFLITVISLSFHIVFIISMLSSMLANPLPSSFLDTYSLFMSSLECKALLIVISFLVLWSIC